MYAHSLRVTGTCTEPSGTYRPYPVWQCTESCDVSCTNAERDATSKLLGAAFELAPQAHRAAATLRSLEKLACSDWCEQGKEHARQMAERIQTHTASCARYLTARAVVAPLAR